MKRHRAATSVVALLLACSGACALVYQVAWLRELRLVFGASTAATAAVLAIFMGGLGLGSALLGRRADESPNSLAMYARLELGVALCAALTPFLLSAVRWTYVALGGSTVLGGFGATLVRLLLSAITLGLPTFLMGGTLPAATRAVESEDDQGRRRLATLYGANTLGAVAGAALATFFMLEIFGTRSTLWLACALNVLVAIVARALARRAAFPAATKTVRKTAVLEPEDRGLFALVIAAAAGVGFVFLLMELVWYRMLGPVLGGSTYTFGLILAVALAGIGLGGALYGAVTTRRPTLQGFALSCALEALCLALPFAAGDQLAMLAALLHPLGAIGFAGRILAWTTVTTLVVLPAAIVAGYQFPLLVGLLGSGEHEVGRHTGFAYAANTAGAIIGSLAGGFVLIPVLSAPGAWRLCTVLLVLLAAAATILAARRTHSLHRLPLPLAAGVLALLFITAPGPSALWRHSPIGAGRLSFDDKDTNSITDWCNGHRRAILWEAEGAETSVALAGSDGLAFVVNGKTDGNARYDAGTQVGLGLVAAALHPAPRHSLVIGLGTGSTAGWLAAVKEMERVDVVELEPAILEVARRCAAVNHAAMDNPKLNLIIGDGRELLLTTPERYDLIVSEPSNPYRAGIASLYTREFYEAVRQRLAEHGIFSQWLQGYEVDTRTVRTVMTTLAAVFPEVSTWQTKGNDLLFVCSVDPQSISVRRLAQRLPEEPFVSGLRVAWGSSSVEGFLARHLATGALARKVAASDAPLGWINTDDRMLVEFGFARTVGVRRNFDLGDMAVAARDLGCQRPAVDQPDLIDWPRVEDHRLAIPVNDGSTVLRALVGSPEGELRAEALDAFLVGEPVAVLRAWAAQDRPPALAVEHIMLAEALALSGDASALAISQRLTPRWPTTAAAVAGQYYRTTGDTEAAIAAFSRAFSSLRHNPWANPTVMRRALLALPALAAEDSELAAKLEELVAEPFAVHLLDNRRQLVRVDLARRVSPDRCVEALAPFAEEPAWNEAFLSTRLDCYRRAGDPHAEQAQRDLDSFLDHSSMSFSESLR